MTGKNFDESVKINYNADWPCICGHPYGILIIGGSGSGKTNECLTKLNETSMTRYWQDLFIQRSIQIKVSIAYQW